MPDSYRKLQSMEMEKRMDEEFELDERKTKILDAIIRNYLETGEPVGSRTISKYTDLNLSSATIRNEMADLEELGYHFTAAYFGRQDPFRQRIPLLCGSSDGRERP